MARSSLGKKQVLILGSGYVVEPLISYLGKDKNIQITLGNFLKITLNSFTLFV